jgi:serine/threonine-protein kinase
MRLPLDLCLFIARELCNGLAYAHRRTDRSGKPLAVVHCDISPPNVMGSFEGEVKIIDFGIAKSVLRTVGSNPNMGFGKFGYMAPEQVIKGGIIDKRTDIYAAGVVLYELLTSERLFIFPEGADYRQMAKMVAQGKFGPPSSRDPKIDADLDQLVMTALKSKQQDRYQTAEEFRDRIQAKLSTINPTFAADQLAKFLRDLFLDEISEEQQLLVNMKATDLTPYKDELTVASVGHTVTFARAPAEPLPSGVHQSPVHGQTSGVKLSTSELLLMHPGRNRLFWMSATIFVLLGMLTALFTYRHLMRDRKVIDLDAPPVENKAPLEPPKVAPPPEPEPPAQEPEPEPAVQTVKVSEHHHKPKPDKAKPAHAHHTPEDVQAKFHQVSGEYASFKSQYGGILEERWNAIASTINFGKNDRYEKVDAMLDELRREMAARRKK